MKEGNGGGGNHAKSTLTLQEANCLGEKKKTTKNQCLDSRCVSDDLRMSGAVKEACGDLQCAGTGEHVSHRIHVLCAACRGWLLLI